MSNGIDYRIGFPNKTIEAMLKSDVPMIREQAQEMIKSQGLEDIDMGQNQLMQSGIMRSPGTIDFRADEVDSLRRDLETTGRDPTLFEKAVLGMDKLYQPIEFGPIDFKPINALGMVSPVPYVPQLTIASGVIGALKNLKDRGMRNYIAGVPTVDQFGNLFTGEQLDRMNSLGGYYSDPAIQSRRRDRRIQRMFDRRAADKSFSQKNLDRLLEQRRQEERARQTEFDRIMSSEQNQRDFYDSLNEGRGATSTAESRSTAGDAPGYAGPSPFVKGGIVGLN
jgi:hypothetical protein